MLSDDGDAEFGDLIMDSDAPTPWDMVTFGLLQEAIRHLLSLPGRHLIPTRAARVRTLSASSTTEASTAWIAGCGQTASRCRDDGAMVAPSPARMAWIVQVRLPHRYPPG